ncbi:hypothetical protein ACJJTC_019493 [Scirpophaga incertulas]
MKVLWWLAAASAWSCVRALNETEQCELWGPLLEEWAVGVQEPVLTRQGRVMALPPTKGYYVSERIDATLMPPPPHRPFSGSYGPYETSSPVGYSQYDEGQETPPTPPSAGKIVNRPPNPYKDKFKPSYPPSQNPAIPVSADRVDLGPPQKQVSETDLYLLTGHREARISRRLSWRNDCVGWRRVCTCFSLGKITNPRRARRDGCAWAARATSTAARRRTGRRPTRAAASCAHTCWSCPSPRSELASTPRCSLTPLSEVKTFGPAG